MGRLLFFLCIVALFGYAMTTLTISRGNVAVASAAQGVSVLDAVTAISADFTETGTLVFYPNNTGPVPYLFYQNPNGSTVAKALVFPYSSPNDFSSWVGAQISVTGHVNSEHVIVSTITYLSAP